jgi:hypothetical protein
MAHNYCRLIFACCFVTSGACFLDDEGVRLGRQLGDAATDLRRSADTQLIVAYKPRSGVNQKYSVGLGKMVWCPAPPCRQNWGALTVAMGPNGRGGSTTIHTRFVAVPRPLMIQKEGEPTRIVLRKIAADTIAVIALR